MSYHLKIDIQSYWHPGTGRGQGSDVDAVTHRNAVGLPVLPGRTLKGILRDAVSRWEQLTGTPAQGEKTLTEQLFGSAADADTEAESNTTGHADSIKHPGLLRVSDAVLAEDVTYHLLKSAETNQGKDSLIPGLYRSLHVTSVEHASGTAKNQSLRGIEVVIPLTLYATIDEVPNAAPVHNWGGQLQAALSLIQAVGAHRTRGLGRAVLTLEDAQ